MKTALGFVAAVVLVAVLYAIKWPTCDVHSPHGPRIGGAILIGGCP